MARFEHVFWRIIDDLKADRLEPPERYSALLTPAECEELADLVASVLGVGGPHERDGSEREETSAAVPETTTDLFSELDPSDVARLDHGL